MLASILFCILNGVLKLFISTLNFCRKEKEGYVEQLLSAHESLAFDLGYPLKSTATRVVQKNID